MSDGIERFEAELASMRPRAASNELIDAIGERIDAGEARPWADRCLLSAIGAGLAASVVIAVMLVGEGSRTTAHGPPIANDVVPMPRFGDSLLAFARPSDGLIRSPAER